MCLEILKYKVVTSVNDKSIQWRLLKHWIENFEDHVMGSEVTKAGSYSGREDGFNFWYSIGKWLPIAMR